MRLAIFTTIICGGHSAPLAGHCTNLWYNTDFYSSDLGAAYQTLESSLYVCSEKCFSNPSCKAFTFVTDSNFVSQHNKNCLLKSGVGDSRDGTSLGLISGARCDFESSTLPTTEPDEVYDPSSWKKWNGNQPEVASYKVVGGNRPSGSNERLPYHMFDGKESSIWHAYMPATEQNSVTVYFKEPIQFKQFVLQVRPGTVYEQKRYQDVCIFNGIKKMGCTPQKYVNGGERITVPSSDPIEKIDTLQLKYGDGISAVIAEFEIYYVPVAVIPDLTNWTPIYSQTGAATFATDNCKYGHCNAYVDAENFVNFDQLEDLAEYHFKIVFEEKDSGEIGTLEWKQIGNPMAFYNVEIPTSDVIWSAGPADELVFKGLSLSSRPETLLDGDLNQNWWWFSIGYNKNHNGGQPIIRSSDKLIIARKTQLFVESSQIKQHIVSVSEKLQFSTHGSGGRAYGENGAIISDAREKLERGVEFSVETRYNIHVALATDDSMKNYIEIVLGCCGGDRSQMRFMASTTKQDGNADDLHHTAEDLTNWQSGFRLKLKGTKLTVEDKEGSVILGYDEFAMEHFNVYISTCCGSPGTWDVTLLPPLPTASTCDMGDDFKFWNGIRGPGASVGIINADSKEECAQYCLSNSRCRAFTYHIDGSRECWLKAQANTISFDNNKVSGARCDHFDVNLPVTPYDGIIHTEL